MRDILNKVTHGDCLEVSTHIKSGSVDLILTDLPYGTAKGMRSSPASMTTGLSANEWDDAIPPKAVYEMANRILRKNGKMVLFSQEPYTSRLITEAIPNVPFSYRMVWEKDHFANSLLAKKAPVSYYEDVLVFSKSSEAIPPHDFDGVHPLRPYFTLVMEYIGLSLKQINSTLGHRRAEHTFYVGSTQFSLCTEKTYRELISVFSIDKMVDFKPFEELKAVDACFKQDKESERLEYLKNHNIQFPSVFNLWEGKKYKSNILKYKKDYDGFHPTQKPILLLEDLVKTFSNEGDVILDLTCGSGSTCVAAIKSGRQFIGIEREPEYVEIANKRIAEAQA